LRVYGGHFGEGGGGVAVDFEPACDCADAVVAGHYESTLPSSYATLACGRAGSGGEIDVINAGHCPPLWVRKGETTAIPASGLPLGMFCRGILRRGGGGRFDGTGAGAAWQDRR
jgi:hypothetical protein